MVSTEPHTMTVWGFTRTKARNSVVEFTKVECDEKWAGKDNLLNLGCNVV